MTSHKEPTSAPITGHPSGVCHHLLAGMFCRELRTPWIPREEVWLLMSASRAGRESALRPPWISSGALGTAPLTGRFLFAIAGAIAGTVTAGQACGVGALALLCLGVGLFE